MNGPRFVQPDIGGAIRRSGQIAAGVIGAIPGLKQQEDDRAQNQKLLDQATKEANSDWNKLTTSYKAVKQMIDENLEATVKQGLITPQQKQSYMSQINQHMPLNAHKKDPSAYITTLNTTVKGIFDEVKANSEAAKQKQQQGQASEFVAGRIRGQEAVPEHSALPGVPSAGIEGVPGVPAKPAVPGAGTQEDVTGAIPPGFSPEQQQQVTKDPRLLSLPTVPQQQKREDVAFEQRMKEREVKSLEDYRKRVINKGYGKDKQAVLTKKFKTMMDVRKEANSNINRKESTKKGYSTILTKLKANKGKELTFDEQLALEDIGLTPGDILAATEETILLIQDEIDKINDDISTINKEKTQATNTIRMLDENPEEALSTTFTRAESTSFEDQPKFGAPPALGGSAQIGQVPPVAEPAAPQIPQPNAVSAVSISADGSMVTLSDGTTITVEEATQRGLVE